MGWGTQGRLLGGGTSPGPGRMVKLRSGEMGRELQAQGMARAKARRWEAAQSVRGMGRGLESKQAEGVAEQGGAWADEAGGPGPGPG